MAQTDAACCFFDIASARINAKMYISLEIVVGM